MPVTAAGMIFLRADATITEGELRELAASTWEMPLHDDPPEPVVVEGGD